VESYTSTTTRIAPLPGGPTCTLIQDLLPLYLEGEVSPSSRDLIVEHLGRCERCAGYLAGAQSIHGELRRDLAQRAVVATAAAPDRRALGWLQRLLAGAMAAGLCVIGGLATIGLASAIAADRAGLALASLTFGLGALIMVFMIAAALGPLRVERLATLCASIGAGFLAGCVLSGGFAGMAVFGLPLALLATAAVVATVLAPTRQHSAI
jgi:predicted anti-sigma-YlaC factor YlaD